MQIIKLNVIDIIQEHTIADNENMKSRFTQHIQHLYQYAIFKDLLDLVATKASQSSLAFNIKEK